MLNYYLSVFKRRSYQKEPVATLMRSVIWLTYHVLLKQHANIRVPISNKWFRLRLPPLLKHFGSTSIYLQRQYHETLLQHVHRLVKNGDVVFDVGANIGIYTAAFGVLVGPSGRVYAFEPQTYAIEPLERNIQLNGLDNVNIEQVAVSSREGEALLDSSEGAVRASITLDFGRTSTEKVKTITLDQFVQRAGVDRVDLIKLDINDGEYDALCGAGKLIDAYRPIIIVKHTRGVATWPKILKLFDAYGYICRDFDESGELVPLENLEVRAVRDVVFLPQSPNSASSGT